MDSGRIYLLDEPSHSLELVSFRGIDPTGLESMALDQGFSGKAVRTKCFLAQYVSEMGDKERAAFLANKGLRIIICLPLINRDKVGGVMNLGKNSFMKLDQGKIDLLTIVGNQIAVAINSTKLYEDLDKRMAALNEKNEMIKLFTYSISHDLKSPAVGIYGLAKRFQENYGPKLDSKGKDYCTYIMNAAEEMVSLIEKINTYIYSKESPFCFEKIDMGQITKAIKNEFKEKLKERQIRLIEPAYYPEIVADKLAMGRIFRNFIDNALKYGGDGLRELKIGHREDNKFHCLSFSDDGIGLKKEEQEKIFEQFQRKSTSRGHEGIGLGLAIVKEIVERHGGRVWIENGCSNGATFCVSISKDLQPDLVADRIETKI
jgi:signal transduction histidine kinase